MPTVLGISGQTFEVDKAILRLSPIEPTSVSRRGDLVRPTHENSPQLIRNSIVLTIGDSGFDEMALEIEESIQFLDENFQAMQAIRNLPGIDHAGIDIGVRWKETFTHTDFIPAELVHLAGRLSLCGGPQSLDSKVG